MHMRASKPDSMGKACHYRECRLDLGKGDCSLGVEAVRWVILEAVLFVSDVDEPWLRCSIDLDVKT